MFTSGFVALFLVSLFAAGNVAGYPVPEPIRRALAQRGPAPFEPIRAYVNRDFYNDALMYEKRQGDNNINTIPEETPTKAPNGVLEAYGKRQIPEQVATKAPNGETVVYEKRQSDNNINTIPEETPTKAPNGVLEAYGKRQIPE